MLRRTKKFQTLNVNLLLWSLAFILIVVTPGLVEAAAQAKEDCQLRRFADRPIADAGPTPVTVLFYIVDISEINDRNQTFDAELYLRAKWHDPRLVRPRGKGICTVSLNDVWSPRLRLLNQRDVAKRFENVVLVDPAGNLAYEQRFARVFTSAGDVADFPFDSRELAISIFASGFSEDEILFEAEENLSGRRDVLSVANWTISDAEIEVSTFRFQEGISFPRARIIVTAERLARYYIWSAIVPLLMIVFMSWGVFWINPSSVGPQIGLAATSMLTLIAYRFTLANVLPPVSYLTRMDVLLLAMSGLVLLAFFEAIATSTLADSNRMGLAKRVQMFARGLFPCLLVAALIWFFIA